MAYHYENSMDMQQEMENKEGQKLDHRRLVGNYTDRGVNPERLELVKTQGTSPILDVGCGGGGYVDILSPEYTVVGVDVLKMENSDSIVRGDATKLPFKDDSFSTVLLFEVLEHLPYPANCLQEIRRVGTDQLLLSVPNAVDPPIFEAAGVTMHPFVDMSHCNFYTETTIKVILERNGFRVVSVDYINPVEPGILFLDMLRLPDKVSRKAGRRLRRMVPWSRDYYMTLLIHARI